MNEKEGVMISHEMLATMIKMTKTNEKLNILYKECLEKIRKQARQIEELSQTYNKI